VVVPHWKYAVLANPFGFTDPFKVAELDFTLVAAPVVAVGVAAACAAE
jgi:hypothetical protein